MLKLDCRVVFDPRSATRVTSIAAHGVSVEAQPHCSLEMRRLSMPSDQIVHRYEHDLMTPRGGFDRIICES